MSDIDVLDRIENTHQATLTHPDGSPLTWLGQLAGAIYLTADFLTEKGEWDDSMERYHLAHPNEPVDPAENYTRKQHASLIGLMSMLGH